MTIQDIRLTKLRGPDPRPKYRVHFGDRSIIVGAATLQSFRRFSRVIEEKFDEFLPPRTPDEWRYDRARLYKRMEEE